MQLAAILGSALVGGLTSLKASSDQKSAARDQLELGERQLGENARQFNTSVGIQRDIRNQNQRTAGSVRDAQLGVAGNTRQNALSYADYGRRAAMGIAGNTRDSQLNALNPFGGTAATDARNYELGIGARPDDYAGFSATPGYQFAFQQGQQAIDGSAAAGGGLFSGATLKAQQQFGTGLANQEYGNHLARLMQTSGQEMTGAGAIANVYGNYGANATNAQNNYTSNAINATNGWGANAQNIYANYGANMTGANTNFSAGYQNAANSAQAGSQNAMNFQGNALANYGDASAAGAIGVNNAVQNGLTNYLGYKAYQNQLNA